MHTISKNHRRSFLCFALLGLVGGFAMPSVGNATTPGINEAIPTAAADDDCPPPKNTIVLEIDVVTGYAYVVDETGMLTPLVNNELDVYVGALGRVLVDLQFSTGEWSVDVSASGSTTTTTHLTRGGALRYWMNTTPVEYLFSATSLSAMTMMNMTPIEPDIVIRPTKDCPPPT